MNILNDITQTIGNTPLIKLQKLNAGLDAQILLKLEFFNPLGSVKDRIALSMIEDAETNGIIKSNAHLVEPTSGNTGIALAFICASRGYKLTLVMPETMSQERRTLLLLLGAEIILTPGPLGMKGAVAKTLELKQKNPDWVYLSQFTNMSNPEIHKKTTAAEIWKATSGNIDAFVSGIGTGGTVTGVGEVLKIRNSKIKIIGVEPEESPVLSGGAPGPHKIQGIGAGFIPKTLNTTILDEVIKISSSEAIETARRLIKQEGIPVGISSGAAVAAALSLASRPDYKNKTIVTILPSYSERYLSTLLAETERNAALNLKTDTVDPIYMK